MNKIILNINKGFSWFGNKNIFVKGYFFDTEDNYYEKENLVSFFENIISEDDFIKKISRINGAFSVIIKTENKIFVASDPTRIFPIFYTFQNKKLYISDDISLLKKEFNPEISEQNIMYFRASFHTIGNTTLLKNVYQVQSSEYLIFENETIKQSGFFFNFSTEKTFTNSYTELKKQAISVFEKSFSRLIKSLGGKHVALPLSGGYDSRLIAVMLKKYGYENVTCFTYGRKNNFELENSEKTAEALNFKWIFIEYNDKIIENYINSDTFFKYIDFAAKYSSMPFMQEYFAVKHLKEKQLIPPDSVFIPGHSGDVLGGTQLIKVVNENLKVSDIEHFIFKKKFTGIKFSKQKKTETLQIIKNNLSNFDENYKEKIPYSTFENYDLKEKFAKFIFNSSSVYIFFDYELRFPYWDKELLNFFKNVPFKYRKLKLLYDDVLKNHYFKKFNINFEKEIQPSRFDLLKRKIKNSLQPIIPGSVWEKRLYKVDWHFYKEITDQMVKHLKENGIYPDKKIISYNSIIVKWYTEYVKGNLK